MTDPAPRSASGMSLAAGDRLGPYEILASLGAGGMGEVYRARDTRLGREVAIKVISDRIAHDPQSLRRFEQEAKAVAALSHPNILAIYDFGTHNAISYVVMELLRGESLEERLAREHLSWRKAVEIAAAVAEGLASAHELGIVHRDLKPANIFLTHDGQVKILDFGLAKRDRIVGSNPLSKVETESQPGLMMGTIGYMAPEQVSGAAVDARADIFALGCILYEMISGERAFRQVSAAQTLAAILRDNPADLSESGRRFPPPIANIVSRCLQKNPEERFQSARDLAFALRAVTDTRGVRVAKVVWAAAVVVFVAAATVVGILRYRTTHQPIGSLAVLPFVNTSHDPQTEFLADGMTDTIINKLAELPQLKVMSHSTMFRYKGKNADPQQVGRDLSVSSVLTGRVIQIGSRLEIETELVNADDGRQLWGERYDRQMPDVFVLQDDIAREISEKLRLKLTGAEQKRLTKRYTDDPEAYSLYLQGRFYLSKATAASIEKANSFFRAALERDHNYALAYLGIADCYVVLPQFAGAPTIEAAAKAKQAAFKALEIDPELAEAHATLGYLYALLWQWQDAETELTHAITLKPNYALSHSRHALFFGYRRRYTEALAETKKAQALDPLSSTINANMAIYLDWNNRKAEAIQQFRRTIDLDPAFGFAHMRLGRLDMEIGDRQNGILELQKAVELSNRSGEALSRLGFAYAQVGRRDDALAIIAELKRKLQRKETSPFRVGYVYAGLGDRIEAYRWFDQALREHDFFLVDINSSPHDFDSWRADPHFQQLLRGMNLAQ